VLIVKIRVASADALKKVAGLVRGDVVLSKAEGKDHVAELVVHDDAELEKLRASGAAMEILFDSRTRPDPGEEVSKVNRFAEEVERLKRLKRGEDKT